MDLVAYGRVLRRQSRTVKIGLAITAVLILFSLVRFSFEGVGWRSQPTYGGRTTLFVTQAGFPWGRSALTEYLKAQGPGSQGAAVPRFAETGRVEYLANLYAELAESDVVRRVVDPKDKLEKDAYTVSALTRTDGQTLPLLEVSSRSTSDREALRIANSVAAALQGYILKNQNQSGVPESTRIALPVVARTREADVLEGRKVTTPLMVLLLGLILTLAVAFGRDNVRSHGSFPVLASAPPVHVEEARPVVEQDHPGLVAEDVAGVVRWSLPKGAGATRDKL